MVTANTVITIESWCDILMSPIQSLYYITYTTKQFLGRQEISSTDYPITKGWLTWGAKPKICGLLGFISLSSILSSAHFFLHFPSLTSPLKSYLESESSSIADEMCSFVRIRQQHTACGFDRLDTSKQTETILTLWRPVCVCLCERGKIIKG